VGGPDDFREGEDGTKADNDEAENPRREEEVELMDEVCLDGE